ncbi:MAG: hypothetical protein ACFFBI_03890, partial [Promethearchaeota archaeon]
IDSSDNIHITGYSEELNDDEDFLYLKYNDEGTLMNSIVWDEGNEANVGRDIILDSSNNIYIAGYTDVNPDIWNYDYDTYIRKLSSGGATQWTRTWGGSESDVARATALDSSGNVYLGGLTWSYGAGQADSLLIKYSSTGTLQWNQTYGGSTSEWVNSMIIDSFDNIFLAGGYQYNDTTDYDSYLIKVDKNGVEQWSRSWGGAGDEIGDSVALDSSQNVYVVGSTSSYGAGYEDLFLLKYNNYGDLIWNITYGTENNEEGWPILIDWQDSIYVGGEFYDMQTYDSSIFIAKFNQNGNQLWNMTYDITDTTEYLYDMKMSSSGDIYLTGGEYFSGTTYMDVYLIKFNYELSEFVIISPEERVYTEPMNGYYLATYGFENVPNGEFPYEWSPESNGGTCQVIQSLGDHMKVVELYDSSVPGKTIGMTNNFTAKQQVGEVEFYVRTNDANKKTNIFLYENSTSDGIFLAIMYHNLCYYKDMTYVGLGTPIENDIWYHILIQFNSTTDKFRLWVNGIRVDYIGNVFPYQNVNTGMKHLSFSTDYYDEDYYSYFDSIGYSWHPTYNIGDNLDEGLLLDFKSKYSLEWKAYSLDDQNNISISGNIVIPFPEDGPHSIQVFGNVSSGNIYETEKRSFIVDTKIPEISILTPIANKIYGELAPKYNLSIFEENLISAWYTMDGGITNFTITDLNDFIDQEAWLSFPDGPITIEFYAKDIAGRIGYKNITIMKDIIYPLTIELVDFLFSTEAFNLTFYIYNETGDSIDFADIQVWWDGTDVSSDVQNLGNGLYFISLEPITVIPGQDPIILQIIAYATGYDGKYFETAISVDPETLQKDTTGGWNGSRFPVEIVAISVSLSAAAVLGGGIYIFMKRRKNLPK